MASVSNDTIVPYYITGEEAARDFGQVLPDYEQQEVLQYSKVYYMGRFANKKREYDYDRKEIKFDDKNYNYISIYGDHVGYRYQMMDPIASGGFGQVIKGFDHKRKRVVAMKVIKNEVTFTSSVGRELHMLKKIRQLKGLPKRYFVQMLGYSSFRLHHWFIFEYLRENLRQSLTSYKKGFPLHLVKVIARQIMVILHLLKRNKIVHADLKPANFVCMKEKELLIKLIDFGASHCPDAHRAGKNSTTRIYSAPEVLFRRNYSYPADMWSAGCTIAELYTGKYMFPGYTDEEVVAKIMEVLGPVPRRKFETINLKVRRQVLTDSGEAVFSSKEFASKGLSFYSNIGKPGSKSILSFLEKGKKDPKEDCNELADLIKSCLTYSRSKRLKPKAALEHPFVQETKEEKAERETQKQKLVAAKEAEELKTNIEEAENNN